MRIRRLGRRGTADSERFLRSSTEAAGFYRPDWAQACAVMIGVCVGASTPPDFSIVAATTEPRGTPSPSGTTVVAPPPPKRPARFGFPPFGMTQAS